jgi:hypothetical protein
MGRGSLMPPLISSITSVVFDLVNLQGRHGAMNPAGRVRIRNIMPIARDYRHHHNGSNEHFVTAITSGEVAAREIWPLTGGLGTA